MNLFRKSPPLPRKLLVVEDDAVLLKAYRALGKRYSMEIVETPRAIDAFRLALIDRPDLIVLDLKLEDGESLRLLQSLRASPETRETPVLVVSGHLSQDMSRRCQEAGATDVLPKPWTVDELLSRLSAHAA
ncbi:MAG: PleD family two-component system response regulator [Myxococcales bacterium]